MPSFNKVILMGNLTRDPELRVTPNNLSICKFGLAVNRRFSTRDGEQREETTFVDLDAFGKPAEIIAKYCSKGSAILVEGRLKLDQWESQQGEKRSKLTVVVENFQFTGGRGDGGGGSEGASGGGYEQSSPPRRSADSAGGTSVRKEEDIDEDVPF